MQIWILDPHWKKLDLDPKHWLEAYVVYNISLNLCLKKKSWKDQNILKYLYEKYLWKYLKLVFL